MDLQVLREMLIDRMRRRGENVEEAARSLAAVGLDGAALDQIVADIRRAGRKNQLLELPAGVVGPSYKEALEGEARLASWYTGPEQGDEFWPAFAQRLQSGSMASVVDEIDMASTKVVAHLADPGVRRLRKKGLVVGYVQSGKTANYTAVMAKSADAGYRLFIVLAGMHNNLRQQTQERLSSDLADHQWVKLTTPTADFGTVVNGAPLVASGAKMIAVVKKNAQRLKSLRDWLRDIPWEVRVACPVLLLDDEADQATPNTRAAQDELSKINELIRAIWSEIPSGSYLGYTATPFANVFMDPNDEEELYPSDFVLSLPKPSTYFGAERIFGRQLLADADEPDPGLDMVRLIPESDSDAMTPPSKKEDRAGFRAPMTESLRQAVTWFVVATAVRRARDQLDKHSSMLVHTTHYVGPHFTMQHALRSLVGELQESLASGDGAVFEKAWLEESLRAVDVATLPVPEWSDVLNHLDAVLADVEVLVDNGYSDDRLNYTEVDETGAVIPRTVIAVGGGTLSRGLTLEGLIVSYFTRTSNTYDTLLQMGRWFGYRPGYEDLPRIWMPESLESEYAFLAGVEEELRAEIDLMSSMQKSPKELGLRIRAHPGRLAITAKNKMVHADLVRIGLSGQRQQTFILHERGDEVEDNWRAGENLLKRCEDRSALEPVGAQRWVYRDIDAETITSFVQAYHFHPHQAGLTPELISGWIRRAAPDLKWTVAVMGNSKASKSHLATEFGPLPGVVPINRAPLTAPDADSGVANIKALMSLPDQVLDIAPEMWTAEQPKTDRDYKRIRAENAANTGLLVLYPIDRDSQPAGVALKSGSRRPMQASHHLLGVGLVYPVVAGGDVFDDGTYYSVAPDWDVPTELDDDVPVDSEGQAQVDGTTAARRALT